MIAGLILVIIGGFLAVAGIMCRFAFFLESRDIPFTWKYYLCIGLSFLGTIPATVGFYLLTQIPVNSIQDYSQILTVLSILATGIITAFFTFSYANLKGDEVALPTLLSVCFVILFYFVFFAISFYIGKSKLIHNNENVEVFVPWIMWILLVANMMYDFMDYRRTPK